MLFTASSLILLILIGKLFMLSMEYRIFQHFLYAESEVLRKIQNVANIQWITDDLINALVQIIA